MNGVARVHFELPDDLHEDAKRLAAQRGQTLKGYITVLLRKDITEAKGSGELPQEAKEAGT
jgi:hypothetical protein